MNTYRYIRWIFLAMGLTAVVGLSGMNVYSLYALHENTVQNTVEKQKRQLLEFTDQVRSRFRLPVNDLWRVDMEYVYHTASQPSEFPDDLMNIIETGSRDSLFSDIYFTFSDCEACERHGAPLWHYNASAGQFEKTGSYSRVVSDGLAMAKTRMNALINDYRWNTRIIFDTQNSMTIALINSSNREIIGYLNFVVDRDYLVHEYLAPKLEETFGTGNQTGIVVWLHNWTRNEVLATTNSSIPYSYQSVNFIQNFPDLLNDWNLKAKFTANPDIAASRASLTRNLIVLAGAVLLLIGALIFMFFTAQRERLLAERHAVFLANVTHELKTPLSVILAAGENLTDGRVSDPKRLKSYGSHIFNESMRLRNMIDRLLDVAKSGSSHIKVRKKPIDVSDFTEQFLEKKKNFLESHGFELVFETENDLPVIQVDPSDLNSILNNLVDNASKYSPYEKRIIIRIYRNNQHVCLDVIDHGTGIPRKSQKYIFDKFYRAEDSLKAQTKGHGLGLAIVKDMTARNNGVITVNSTPGKGSTFTLAFPAAGNGETGRTDKQQFKTNNLQEA